MTRCLSLLLLVACAPAAWADGHETFAKSIQPFLKQHCMGCHSKDRQESGIRLDRFETYRSEDSPLWTKVHEAIATGKMPPRTRPRPAGEQQRTLLTWIETQQKLAGVDHLRRLNRRELSAALQDLTGLPIAHADALPGDGKLGGFDTGATALQDAADSVDQMMQITRRAVDSIRLLEPAKGETLALNFRGAADPRKALDSWKDKGLTIKTRAFSKPGQGLLLEPRWVGERDVTGIVVPAPTGNRGVLRLKLVVSAFKPLAKVPAPHLWVAIAGKDIDYREITGTFDQPQELSYHIQLDDLAIDQRGIKISLVNRVEVPYAIEGFANEDVSKPEENIPGGTGLFRPSFDRQRTPPEKQPAPFVVLQRIEIEPGYTSIWPPEAWQAKIGKLSDDPDCAARLLHLWIERAWRRPVRAAEQEPFLNLYRKVRAEGLSFDEAMRAAFQSVLLSTRFRYLAAPADKDGVVAQHAIAARLSFLLWGSPPDVELRQLAAAGKLREPAVLDAQVDRLLADARSQQFFGPFVVQWLEMEQPITIASTHIRKQDFRFARYLKASLRDETVAYVTRLVNSNRPARELIDSDWAMMNDILALHYGYDGISGGELRPVKLRDSDPRGGGLLGHAGIQSMLCWMGSNWVIYRGAWTLRHILDDPPPPPPLEVPELQAAQGKTFKELLRQHQENASCAVCHRKMDPLGFAFQNFDISGRWRDVEHEKYAMSDLDGKIAWCGVGKTRPVDTLGRLPRGEEFKTFAECKQLMIKNYQDDLVRGVLKNLVIYGAGRLPDVHDLAELKRIMKEQQPRGYPLGDLLKMLVRSPIFLGR